MVPMPEFMRHRKTLALRGDTGVDSYDRPILAADDTSLAGVEFPVLHLSAEHPGDGLDVDLVGLFNTEPLQKPFGQG